MIILKVYRYIKIEEKKFEKNLILKYRNSFYFTYFILQQSKFNLLLNLEIIKINSSKNNIIFILLMIVA